MNALIIPGHNSHGDKPRFVALTHALKAAGWSLERFSAQRVEHVPGEEHTLTVDEEYAQVKKALKDIPRPRIAIGHSQGGALALRLGFEGLVDGVVCLMGDTSSQEDVNTTLANLGADLHEVREQGWVRFERDSGQANWYSAEFFEDYLMWNIPIYATAKVPKLFIAGAQDPWNTPEKVQALVDEAREPKAFVTVACGHNFEEEHVSELAEHVLAWRKLQL